MEPTLRDLERAGIIIVNQNGVVNLTQNANRSVSITDSTLTDTQIITGDNSTQNINKTSGVTEEMFAAFLAEIDKLPEGEEKNNALADAKSLQDAVKKGNWERAKKIYSLFSNALRDSAAGVTIAKALGLLPPLP